MRTWRTFAAAGVSVAALSVAACAGTANTTSNTTSIATAQTQQPVTDPASMSDAQLRAFVAAREEITPLQQGFAAQTPEQRTQATEQIRQILERNNLDSATYNAIAARAQAEPAFAQHIQDVHRLAQTQDDANAHAE